MTANHKFKQKLALFRPFLWLVVMALLFLFYAGHNWEKTTQFLREIFLSR